MKIDYEYAIIDLSAQEAEAYEKDPSFKRDVTRAAEELSDQVQRTVEVYSPDGNKLDTVCNY